MELSLRNPTAFKKICINSKRLHRSSLKNIWFLSQRLQNKKKKRSHRKYWSYFINPNIKSNKWAVPYLSLAVSLDFLRQACYYEPCKWQRSRYVFVKADLYYGQIGREATRACYKYTYENWWRRPAPDPGAAAGRESCPTYVITYTALRPANTKPNRLPFLFFFKFYRFVMSERVLY